MAWYETEDEVINVDYVKCIARRPNNFGLVIVTMCDGHMVNLTRQEAHDLRKFMRFIGKRYLLCNKRK